jgi:hypothetical protein
MTADSGTAAPSSGRSEPRRFFSSDSFWNTRIGDDPQIARRNAAWLDLLRRCTAASGFHINLHSWTIPVYAVTEYTPLVVVQKRFELVRSGQLTGREAPTEGLMFLQHAGHRISDGHSLGHGGTFGPLVPLPVTAQPDGEVDSHCALVDWNRGLAWDMWGMTRTAAGGWCSFTGMNYDLDGTGTFDLTDCGIENGESIHLYGPSRASGTPAIAGLIMHHELASGAIEHKLAFGCRAPALLQYVFPASWTDGGLPGGIPQGTVIQLDPTIDLGVLNLTPAARIIARTLQLYGAVLVDFAGGVTLYGEGLWSHPGRTWDGLLSESDLDAIPFHAFRFIEPTGIVERGMAGYQNLGIMQAYRDMTGNPVAAQDMDVIPA